MVSTPPDTISCTTTPSILALASYVPALGDNLGKRRPHRVAVCQTQPDAAGLRLVQYVRRVHLDGNRIPDPLRRCHRRVRIGRNLIPRRRHPKRRHQRLAVKLGKRAAG